MTRLFIIGAGGHGKVVAETAQAIGYDEIVFLTMRGQSSGKLGLGLLLVNLKRSLR
jgi:D-arabinose 1-dehydrogenase-like Zn-dependent alcohol dehydrogenase